MNTFSPTAPSSDDTVSSATTTSLPELSDLHSSASTFQSNSSISSIATDTEELLDSPSSELQQGQQTSTNNSTTAPARSLNTSSPSTSTSRSPIRRNHLRLSQSTATRRCNTGILVLNNLLKFSYFTIMNAAITIFGVGIGVGLILADSFRSPATTRATNMGSHSDSATAASARRADEQHRDHHATMADSAATPTCRATIRRAMDRIQEAPPINLASISALPAQ